MAQASLSLLLKEGTTQGRLELYPKALSTLQPSFLEWDCYCPAEGSNHQQRPLPPGHHLAAWDSPKKPSSWAVACKNWNSCST